MIPIQAVTLVTSGGTPMQLADQRGAPYATTGFGALVYNTGPHLIDAVLEGSSIAVSTFKTFGGTFYDPAIQFTTTDKKTPGFFSTGEGNISLVGTDGTEPSRTLLATFDFPGILTIPQYAMAQGTIPSNENSAILATTQWVNAAIAAGVGSGTVTSVSVTTLNGLAGTVATPTTTPAISLVLTVSGILLGNAGAITTAVPSIDYLVPADLTPYAPLASPAFTGNPTAPTQPTNDNDTSIATTAYVKANIAALPAFPTSLPPSGPAGGVLSGNYPNPSFSVTPVFPPALLLYAPLDSPALTGNPTAPTAAVGDNDTSIATTAFVKSQGYAPLASPAFTGSPTAPTPPTSDNTTSIATTQFVKAQNYAPQVSPVFTGDPQAPTPATGDNDTSIATTAWVKLQGYTSGDLGLYLPLAGGTLTGQLNSTTTLTGASTPAINVTQTWNNAATTFEAFRVNAVDTASTTASLLANWLLGGVSRVTISKDGSIVTVGNITVGANQIFGFNGRSRMWSAADGILRLSNVAGTDFTRLQFGLTTNAAPAIKKSGAALNIRLADDSADADITFKTQLTGTNNTTGATTAFVAAAVGAITGLPPTGTAGGVLSGTYPNPGFATTPVFPADLVPYAQLASPVFTGDPRAPTPVTADDDTSIATTAYVKAQGYATAAALAGYLPLTGGTLAGPGTLTMAALNATTGTFSGAVTGTSATFAGNIFATAGSIIVDRAGDGTDAAVQLRTDAGFFGQHYFMTGSVTRWLMGKNSTAEGGSNAGSDFFIRAYTDGGASLGDAITIARATRAINFLGALTATTAAFSGNVTFPTQVAGTNNTTGATTAFVATAVASAVGGATPTGPAGGDLSGTYPNPLIKPSVTNGQVLTTVGGVATWTTPTAGGTVTTVSVASANGFAGTVATATTTPAITLSTTVTGVLKGDGTAISAAVAGTDYMTPGNVSGLYLALTGGTLAGPGNLTMAALTATTGTFSGAISTAAGSSFASNLNVTSGTFSELYLSSGTANQARLSFRTGTVARWFIEKNTTAESGSNAGADLVFLARDDAGGLLGAALTITRSTRVVTFGAAPSAPGITLTGAMTGTSATFSTSVLIDRAANTSALTIAADPAQYALVFFNTDALNRWYIGKLNGAESTGNAGSDFGIQAYSDAGTGLGTALIITRATRITTFTVGPLAPTPLAGATTTELVTAAWVLAKGYTSSTGTVSTVSVVAANGFAGTVATATSTPAITLSTSVTGMLKGDGTAISAAVAGTDFVPPSALATYLPLAGGTLSGPLFGTTAGFSGVVTTNNSWVVDRTGAAASANNIIRVDTAQPGYIYWQTGTANRWIIGKNPTAEGGANAGSNFYIIAYDDAGTTQIGNAVVFTRSNLGAAFGGAISTVGSITSTAGSINVGGSITTSGGSFVLDRTGDAVDGSWLTRVDAGFEGKFYFQTAAVTRWIIAKSATAEGGSNAGSDLYIQGMTDAGGSTGIVALGINRATGNVILGSSSVSTVPLDRLEVRIASAATTPGGITIWDNSVSSAWNIGQVMSGLSFGTSDTSSLGAGIRLRFGQAFASATGASSDFVWEAMQTAAGPLIKVMTLSNQGVVALTNQLLSTSSATFTGSITTSGSLITNGSNLQIDRTGDLANADFYMMRDAGSAANIIFRTGATSRFLLGVDGVAEVSPTNVGSNFFWNAYGDTGTFLGSVLTVARATRIVNFGVSPTAPTPPATSYDTTVATTAFVQGMTDVRTLRSFGAAGNDTADDFAAITAALAAQAASFFILSGEGLTYRVDGNLIFPDGAYLIDTKFRQGAPELANRRTLGGSNHVRGVTLIRVSVDRNGTPDSISTVSDAAGIWMSGDPATKTAKYWFEDVEVFGSGRGLGILLGNCNTVTAIRPYIHDMYWHTTGDPGSGGEQIAGFITSLADYVYVDDPQIHRLMGWVGTGAAGGPLVAYQSDAMGFGTTKRAQVMGGQISFCAEGYDGSGSGLSNNVWFYGTEFIDCMVGWKSMAHRDSGAVGCVAVRPGFSGFTCGSNSTTTAEVVAKNLRFSDCTVVDCGASHPGTFFPGVTINRAFWAESDGVNNMENIRFDNCVSKSHVAVATGAMAAADGSLIISAVASGTVVKGQNIAGTGVKNVNLAVTALSWLAGVVTATTASAHGLAVGNLITVDGATPVGYNVYTVPLLAGTTGSTLKYAVAVNPGTATVFGTATSGTFIVERGYAASIIGSITGTTTLTVNTVHFGAVRIGQRVMGPDIPEGITIASGSGTSWTLSGTVPVMPFVAIQLNLSTMDTSITGSISGTTLTVSAVSYGTVMIGQRIDAAGVLGSTFVIAGSGASWTVSRSQTLASTSMFLTLENVFTVSPSQTVASTTLTMTSNTQIGFMQGGADNCVFSDVISTGAVLDYHGSITKRLTTFNTAGDFQIFGKAAASQFDATDGSNAYLIAGSLVLNRGTYVSVFDGKNAASLVLGSSGDQNNYYRQTAHRFQNTGGSVDYLSLSATLATFAIPVSGTTATFTGNVVSSLAVSAGSLTASRAVAPEVAWYATGNPANLRQSRLSTITTTGNMELVFRADNDAYQNSIDFNRDGGATFRGPVSGTSATFSGAVGTGALTATTATLSGTLTGTTATFTSNATTTLSANSTLDGGTYIAQTNSSTGASAGVIFRQTVGGRFVDRTIAYTSQYLLESGTNIATRYSDFDLHWWRNNAGTAQARMTANVFYLHSPDSSNTTIVYADNTHGYIRPTKAASNLYLGAAGSSIVGVTPAAFIPASDGGPTLGTGSARWNTVYAATGTINTSSADEKTEISAPSLAEREAARRIKTIGVKRYKFRDAVEAKGAKARWHVGYVAEDVRDALAAENLDPWAYGMLCADEVDGKIRLGLRYDELQAFLACAG